jgi:gamma-glutamylcyclotransferase (GGCT)/AIG2-like uncharacterized protein YtfP
MLSFFVYGSLKPGFHNFEIFLEKHNLEYQKATVLGDLYGLKDKNYPALIKGDKLIEGYVFQTNDQQLICDLDKLENYFENNHDGCEYLKTLTDVTITNTNEIIEAYVYFYNNIDNEFNNIGDLIEINRLSW